MTLEDFRSLRPVDPRVLEAAADVPALSSSELLVVYVLLLASESWEPVEISAPTIASRAHVNVSTVGRVLSRLSRLGIVSIYRWRSTGGTTLPNTYAINADALWEAREARASLPARVLLGDHHSL
jgi:transcription initiation factor IIE alpha subunit